MNQSVCVLGFRYIDLSIAGEAPIPLVTAHRQRRFEKAGKLISDIKRPQTMVRAISLSAMGRANNIFSILLTPAETNWSASE